MIKKNMYIEIVRSTTPGLSSMSQESCSAIYSVLTKRFIRVRATAINNLADLEALVDRQPDLVFLGMEFIPLDASLGLADPNKLWLSDYFDEHGIAYTGSSQTAHEFERNKPLAKSRILDAGLVTSAFVVVKQNQSLKTSDITMEYPLFVKPTNRGGGLGISSDSVVHTFDQLKAQIEAVTTRYHSDSLVEEYLPGREFSVAILKDIDSSYIAMPIELVAPSDENGARLLSSTVKSSNTEQVLEVADEVTKTKVCTLALDSFHALGARDYGRIDIRLDADGIPHFLEANLIPSLISGYGSFPKSCELNIGLEYEPMIKRITDLGLARSFSDIKDDPKTITILKPVTALLEI